MGKIKTPLYSFVLLLLVITGTNSCSLEKRLHSPGFHVEFHKREKTHQPKDHVQKRKEQNLPIAVHTENKENRYSNQVDTTSNNLLAQEMELSEETTFQNESPKHNTFQDQRISNELRVIPIKVSELMEYKTNKLSKKAQQRQQGSKAERYGGMITGGGMDWLIPILVAIGAGLIIGLIVGLMASSVQVFLGVAALTALILLLTYFLIWGLLSLIGL